MLPKIIRHTVITGLEMHRFGDGQRMATPQGYKIDFFLSGEYVESRSYQFDIDEAVMATRVAEWVRHGKLNA